MELDMYADAYLLSERELKILLAGMKQPSVFGMLSEQAAENSEEKSDVYQTLFDMVRMEKLQSDGDAFSIPEPIRTFVGQIGSAETVFLIEMPEEGYPLCCYGGERPVVTSRVPYQPHLLRLRQTTPTELLDGVMAALDARMDDAAAELSGDSLWQETEPEQLAVTVYRNRKKELTLRVIRSPLSPAEIVTELPDGSHSAVRYDTAEFRNLLQFYLGGKE